SSSIARPTAATRHGGPFATRPRRVRPPSWAGGQPGMSLDPRGRADVAEIEPFTSFLALDGDAFDGRTGDNEHFIAGPKEQIRFFHKHLQARLGPRALPKLHFEFLFATADETDGDYGLHRYLLVPGAVLKLEPLRSNTVTTAA